MIENTNVSMGEGENDRRIMLERILKKVEIPYRITIDNGRWIKDCYIIFHIV